MNRTLVPGILFGLALILGAISPAVAAAATGISTDGTSLVADPYLDLATVSTSGVEAVKCPCTVIIGCAYQPVGYDCAEPAGCCHCYGADPALRRCVYNAH